MSRDEGYTEADWKLFRRMVPVWQEAAVERLNSEYVAILSDSDRVASERFWEVAKRIRSDQRTASVQVEMRRSRLLFNIARLLEEGTIGLDDLEGFSDELRERMALFMSLSGR